MKRIKAKTAAGFKRKSFRRDRQCTHNFYKNVLSCIDASNNFINDHVLRVSETSQSVYGSVYVTFNDIAVIRVSDHKLGKFNIMPCDVVQEYITHNGCFILNNSVLRSTKKYVEHSCEELGINYNRTLNN